MQDSTLQYSASDSEKKRGGFVAFLILEDPLIFRARYAVGHSARTERGAGSRTKDQRGGNRTTAVQHT